MKINYVLSHPIQYQSPLIKYLNKKKIEIKVFYRSNISVMNKKYYDYGFKKKIKWDISLLSGYKFYFLKKIGPNKVTNVLPLTIEFITILKDCEYIWIHGLKNWYNLLIIFLSKIFNKKIIIRDELHYYSKTRSKINLIFNKIFFKIINLFIYRFLYIGTANKNFYLFNKIPKNKLIFVPYVVDNNFFFQKKIKVAKKIRFLVASKFIKRKGIDLLLKSISICNISNDFKKNTLFKIVGNGEEKENLLRLKKENKLTNVFFDDFKNQNEIKKEYFKNDILVIPSLHEPWGLVINEAMAAGNVIISSNLVGASFDLVKNNFNGYKFKNGNKLDLARTLKKIYRKKNFLLKMKKNSQILISDWSFLKCYQNLIKL
jgi:glycosyltransferase involved in cell wall biosynthesis